MIFASGYLFAQSGTTLAAEIQNLERRASGQGVSPEVRHDALVRLARIRQLSGDIDGAARNWLEAAQAIPGTVDDDALLSCAFCLAAMGEWDRASAAIEPLLSKNIRARFLSIAINAIRTGNLSMLESIVNDSAFFELKPQILFFLWKLTQNSVYAVSAAEGAALMVERAEGWRRQLVTEFPHSPEGRLAVSQSASYAATSSVVINPSPFWFFLSGFDSLPLLASEPGSRGTNPSNEVPRAQPANPPENPPSISPGNVVTSNAIARLQTGVFGQEANAQAQITALRQAGFTASIEQRTVNNTPMWAVIVQSNADINRAMSDLRAAGFDSFPVR